MLTFSIRPHHMLCLQFFEGKGYNDRFTENMSQVKTYLDNENPPVQIVQGADDICKGCPHRRGDICKDEQVIREHDKRVYEQVCRLGTRAYWNDIKEEIENQIINPKKVKQVCVKCKWSDICFYK